MIRFFIILLAITCAAIGIVEFANQGHLFTRPSYLYETTIFLAFATGVMFRYLYRINQPDTFVQLYLLMMAVKLLGFGGYVYFLVTADKMGIYANIVYFLILYLVFTALEVIFLYKKINRS